MTKISEDLWKKVYEEAPHNSKKIDFSCNRVTFHRNYYTEDETIPFESTYFNSNPGVISNNTTVYLDGLIEALSTMKEGETSYFIMSYKKMYNTVSPLVKDNPDINFLCELNVIEVEDISDQTFVEKAKTFKEVKNFVQKRQVRADRLFKNQKYVAAINLYQKMTQELEYCKIENAKVKPERNELLAQILTNLATCFISNEEPKKALEIIQKLETMCCIHNNVKALMIKEKSLNIMGYFEEAMAYIEYIFILDPDNSQLRAEFQKLMENHSDIKTLINEIAFQHILMRFNIYIEDLIMRNLMMDVFRTFSL